MPFWPSPISTRDVAGSGVRPGWPVARDGRVWWTEDRPDEGARTTIMCRAADGTLRDLLPAPWNARTRVHEYGGRPYAVTPEGAVVFAHLKDQRLYLLPENGEPKPLTPEGDRYADLLVHDEQVWCVREHHADGKVTRAVVSIPLDGGEIREWATGCDFYASPAISPDGRHLAYICWDHPRMPWDGTELRITRLPHDSRQETGGPRTETGGPRTESSTAPSNPRDSRPATPSDPWEQRPTTPSDPRDERPAPSGGSREESPAASGDSWKVSGGPAESVLAPAWKDDARLYLVSDASGWWNLYEIGLHGDSARALCPASEEFTLPPWQLGGMPYTMLPDGRLAVLHGRGDLRLGILDPTSGTLTDLDVPYTGWNAALTAEGTSITGIAYGSTTPRSVIAVDAQTGEHHPLQHTRPSLPDPAYLPVPQAVRIRTARAGDEQTEGPQTPDGIALESPGDLHAFLYPPKAPPPNALSIVPLTDSSAPPPYIVFVHGGPTAHADTALDLEKAFLTSRGIGVLDLNYGGSTGYGRAYRDRLKGQWGLVDVEDTIAAARWLADEGLADPARIAVRGGSAGGWTVMAACCRSDVFAGGVSYYGISALAPLIAHTHDFESRYVEWLVGPEDPQVYAAREPLALVDGVTRPMLLLQGLEDPVVPPEQSAAFADALAERGVSCTYLAFEGESHGFRRTETRAAALAAELSFYQQLFG